MSKPLHIAAAIILALIASGCTLVNHSDTVATVQPQDPDRVLYEQGLQDFVAQRYGEGIVLLETLTASYPQSRYAEPGEQALKDCDRLETCAATRAVIDHHGGMTFFSNMPTPASGPGPKTN